MSCHPNIIIYAHIKTNHISKVLELLEAVPDDEDAATGTVQEFYYTTYGNGECGPTFEDGLAIYKYVAYGWGDITEIGSILKVSNRLEDILQIPYHLDYEILITTDFC